jgi:hypothetical protein
MPAAYSLIHSAPHAALHVHLLLETDDVAGTEQALEMLALPRAMLIERQAGDRHFEHAESVARSHAVLHPTAFYALSGRAYSIQRIERALRLERVTSRRISSSAHWGRPGFGLGT